MIKFRCKHSSFNKSIDIVCNQGIKFPDEILDVLYENTYILGDAMQNSIGIIAGKAEKFITRLLCEQSSFFSCLLQTKP